jgi:hypothetical protein
MPSGNMTGKNRKNSNQCFYAIYVIFVVATFSVKGIIRIAVDLLDKLGDGELWSAFLERGMHERRARLQRERSIVTLSLSWLKSGVSLRELWSGSRDRFPAVRRR